MECIGGYDEYREEECGYIVYREVNENHEPTGRYVLIGNESVTIYEEGKPQSGGSFYADTREVYNIHKQTYATKEMPEWFKEYIGVPERVKDAAVGDIIVRDIEGGGYSGGHTGCNHSYWEPRVPDNVVLWKNTTRMGSCTGYYPSIRVWSLE